ncbi:hypothetical protein Bca4012_031568 [Brassica carinata]
MIHQSPVCLKTSRNSLLSTGPHLSMRENSNMVLVPEYKKAKEQHKNRNMRRRSDLNLAKSVIKEFEHPSIQGKTMYSSVNGGSNEGGTWRMTRTIAKSVLRDGRFQSYLAMGGPSWLHDLIQTEVTIVSS